MLVLTQIRPEIPIKKRTIKNQVKFHDSKFTNSMLKLKTHSEEFENLPYLCLLKHLRNNLESFVENIYSKMGVINKVGLLELIKNNIEILNNMNIFNLKKDSDQTLSDIHVNEEINHYSNFEENFKGFLESDMLNEKEHSVSSGSFLEPREAFETDGARFEDELHTLCNFTEQKRFQPNTNVDGNTPNLICEQSDYEFIDLSEQDFSLGNE